jgi:hypothetical protein
MRAGPVTRLVTDRNSARPGHVLDRPSACRSRRCTRIELSSAAWHRATLRRRRADVGWLAMWSPFGPGRDSLAAVFLGRLVAHHLGELPAMAGQVFDGAFPLAVLPVGWRLEYPGPVGSGPLAPGP